ncbi:Ubp13p [Sugiyamaella lignohabitans]|uniref:Ubiquitin carboxyl-terminal hydrolase n=1 Tax=Sugiyamaella lignohabitans TaxID=796027 RepID=A0A161HN96_9ASCO|nr:Ubp13p [Sugiyamaella lignohabitans]ANB15567.1 Ubp13p [Sugiyamaella lignohabitans]
MTVESPVDYDSLGDGSAKIFGMENFGNTCYCNSILQCLYYSKAFREKILAFPPSNLGDSPHSRNKRTSVVGLNPHPFAVDPAAALNQSGLNAQELAALQTTLAQSAASGVTASTIHNSVSLPTHIDSPTAAHNSATSNTNGSNNNGSGGKSVTRRMSLFGRKDSHSSNTSSTNVSHSLDSHHNSSGNNGFFSGSGPSIAGSPGPASFINATNSSTMFNGQSLDTSASKKPPYEGLNGVQLGSRFPGQNIPVVGYTEDPFATPETRKRAALIKGPIINMDLSMSNDYSMDESLFTSLKDLFESMSENSSRIGVVSPSKLIEVLKRENELFRSSMHQDAHEFFNFLLNEVIESVDRVAPKVAAAEANGIVTNGNGNGTNKGHSVSSQSSAISSTSRWVHELFEGLLTSETKCLTCETVSRRDEQFLDLSIDLERNTSITACLRQFSASEMLCERNKFHCDTCGGLQEAEKRMKVKKLPKILALHLKRFKFTEDMQRNVKLFHRVLYPKHFRLFNTTFDAEDPDKLYELCAVVVHIGGGPYHGHYVSVVKTEHMGWLLFDDEMVESVDPNYVFNFFGDNKGMATAYVLFYQEISPSDMEKENLYANDDFTGAAHGSGVYGTAAPNTAASTVAPTANPSLIDVVNTNGTNTNGNVSTTAIAEDDERIDPIQSIHPGIRSAAGRTPSTSSLPATTSASPRAIPQQQLFRTNTTTAAGKENDPSLMSIKEDAGPVPAMPQTRSASVSTAASVSSSAPSTSPGGFKLRTSSFGRKMSKKRKDGEDVSANTSQPSTSPTSTRSRGLSFSFGKK